jgi:UDP-N-acetylmuramate--alanine ligase
LFIDAGVSEKLKTTEKIRIGIFFGGRSREREVSFAGGRTVYDNLNKSIFEPIAIFVDSFGNFVLLDWQYIYKGSIRDFYPPVEFLPASADFQLYAENLDANGKTINEMIRRIGKKISAGELSEMIDFAFLCLHGPYGEDGRIQGLLEYFEIPYSGSGIFSSATGINKALQKDLMIAKNFSSPAFLTVDRRRWIDGKAGHVFSDVKQKVGFPCVVKPAGQGSSIGVTILNDPTEEQFMAAVEKALFTRWLSAVEWASMDSQKKTGFTKDLADIREGLGLPLCISYPAELQSPVICSPGELIAFLDKHLKEDGFVLESLDAERTAIIESFIDGKEFSCIVVEDEDGNAIALPPTEIRKGKELFDYRSKYLPGLSRKITPIDLPDAEIRKICGECERLFRELHFEVYARIDGFLGRDGQVILNDPNTTSGMMPSSFFFHQAAEIGLNPSQFLTFIIRTSLACRIAGSPGILKYGEMLKALDGAIAEDKKGLSGKVSLAVILGGYSSERHISVESGRNVYEKLSSSEKYAPFPVFLTGNSSQYELYKIPVNLLLKDNADDIAEKIAHFRLHPVTREIMEKAASISAKYASSGQYARPEKISFQQLKETASEVFIGLHGRPGEDGAIQEKLEEIGLPYNGSGRESSSLTIDKYRTNEVLRAAGLHVAGHLLVRSEDWMNQKESVLKSLQEKITYPFIAKPVDDGCSSAVKKIHSAKEFEAYCRLLFRSDPMLDENAANLLHIKIKEEIPRKDIILVEQLITKGSARRFLEITGGMLTKFDSLGKPVYEVFEASEALADEDILSLEEKFLAGQGQNITPARYSDDPAERTRISEEVKKTLEIAAKALGVTGYCRIDAFVRIYDNGRIEVIFIEVNSLPGMTPATCIFHQAAINGYKPYEFIDHIMEFGRLKQNVRVV